MALQYYTSDDLYKVTVPYTKQELLTMNQEYVNPTDIAPTRNKHSYSLFSHDLDGHFYGVDIFSKYLINGKDLNINYEENQKSFIDTFSIFEVDENGSLVIKYKTKDN